MNERIKDLLPNPYAVDYRDEPLDLYTEVEMQKFAEKIIRECCNIMMDLRTRPADLTVKDIKNHFGVDQ